MTRFNGGGPVYHPVRLAVAAALALSMACSSSNDDEANDDAPTTTSEEPAESTEDETTTTTEDSSATEGPPVTDATSTTEANTHETAADALRRQIGYLSDGQTGRAYQEIHPEQQALFTVDQYGECLSSIPDAEVVSVEETYNEPLTIPGTETVVDSVAITAEVRLGGQTDTDTYHEVYVDGRWVFTVFAAEDIAAGTC